MEYGKPFGVGTTGAVVIFGYSIGYGWLILGGVVTTVACIAGIRYFFRRNKRLGE